ncbi:MAG: response regulator [Gemmatimonadaceae bacterium]|nr:response regulator [Gemmatimonadaceae bacterium]
MFTAAFGTMTVTRSAGQSVLGALVTLTSVAGAPAVAQSGVAARDMTDAAPAWWIAAAFGAVSVVIGLVVVGMVRRRNLLLLERARTAEATAYGVLASEERFRRLFDRGTDPQLLCDGQHVVAANPAAVALLADGHTDLLIGVGTEQLTTDGHDAHGEDATYETDVTPLQGGVIPVAVRRTRIPLETGEVIHYALRDLRDTRRLESERRELEAQLLASQRLEALGTLAGGVAHDFNNLLTVIRANAEIAQIAMAEHDPEGVAESLTAVVQASDRARDIVKQILLFSRRSVPMHARINLAALITDTQTLLRATIPTTVQLLVEVRNADAWINGDATQMQQLLLNLCSNAEHAMRHTNGGLLRITVDSVSLADPHHSARHPQLMPGTYVRLSVVDTGTGMSSDVRQRIFEPFFTTKPIGEGTGLGLAVLHGIVMSHRGSVHVESTEGSGTHFELLFGLVAAPTEGSSSMYAAPHATTSFVTPRDRSAIGADAPLILLVDDEPGILRAAERGIISAGMRAVTAGSASAALDLLDDFDDIAVLITDQTMPGMTGLTLAEHVRTLRPTLPIILSTGYTGRISPERLAVARIDAVLDKPYTLTQLTDAIHGALRNGRRSRVTQRT